MNILSIVALGVLLFLVWVFIRDAKKFSVSKKLRAALVIHSILLAFLVEGALLYVGLNLLSNPSDSVGILILFVFILLPTLLLMAPVSFICSVILAFIYWRRQRANLETPWKWRIRISVVLSALFTAIALIAAFGFYGRPF